MNAVIALLLASTLSPSAEAQSSAREEASAIIRQAHEHWPIHCDNPVFLARRYSFDVRVDRDGRLVGQPMFVGEAALEVELGELPYSEAFQAREFRDRARVAIIQATPFEVPPTYHGGFYRVVFAPDLACRSRGE